MNSATLKTLREALGLPVPWFANFCVVQERTVRHWESGRNSVPTGVATAILVLEKAAAEMVGQLVTQVRALIAEHGLPTGPVPIVRYADDEDLGKYQPNMAGLPVTFHGAALARARWALAADGVELQMHTLDAQAYQAWLRSTSQKDSSALRAQFVALA